MFQGLSLPLEGLLVQTCPESSNGNEILVDPPLTVPPRVEVVRALGDVEHPDALVRDQGVQVSERLDGTDCGFVSFNNKTVQKYKN